MLLSVFISGKTYPAKKYFYVMLIVLGVVLFMYKKPTETTKLTDTNGIIGIGEFLLVSNRKENIHIYILFKFSLFHWYLMV